MRKPDNYDISAAILPGEFENLEPGGYVCQIVKVEEKNSQKGRPMVVFYFDIFEGEHRGIYRTRYDSNMGAEKKWPNSGTYRQPVDGESTKFFKGIIEKSIEPSNRGFKFDWDEKKLMGKLFGGVFGREEYFSMTQGKRMFSTKLMSWMTVEDIRSGKFQIPDDKLLNGFEEPPPLGFLDDSVYMTPEKDLPF